MISAGVLCCLFISCVSSLVFIMNYITRYKYIFPFAYREIILKWLLVYDIFLCLWLNTMCYFPNIWNVLHVVIKRLYLCHCDMSPILFVASRKHLGIPPFLVNKDVLMCSKPCFLVSKGIIQYPVTIPPPFEPSLTHCPCQLLDPSCQTSSGLTRRVTVYMPILFNFRPQDQRINL